MACTGELPPNTNKGQSFIHDPKVAGETEVKAQIKLRFYNAAHKPFIVVRSFQLTQKKNTLSFKALDSTIQMLDEVTGQMEALPHRCADLNTAVPVFMGVSKAILENVIFVHQEESNWPLAESQVLKKKFDDIFSATKYTKALDDLRKLRTKQLSDAKAMRAELTHLKTHKDNAARLETSIADSRNKAAKLQREIERLSVTIRDCVASRTEVNKRLCSLNDHGEGLVSLQARYDLLVAKNAETYARLVAVYSAEEVAMSDEDLHQVERDFQSSHTTEKADLQRLERELHSTRLQVEALREQGDREAHILGRLQVEAEAHERNVEERDRFLRRVCVEIGAVAPSSLTEGVGRLSPEALRTLIDAFQVQLGEARRAVDAAKASHRTADEAQGRLIDEVAAQISGVAEGLRMKEEAVRTNEMKLQKLQEQLDAEAGASRGALDAAEARAAQKTQKLHEKEEELATSSLAEDCQRISDEMAGIASKMDVLREERRGLAAATEDATRMNFKAQELETALTKITQLMDRHRSKLMMTLNVRADAVPEPGHALMVAVRAAAEHRKSEYEAAASVLRDAQARKSAAEGTLRATRAQLSTLEAELVELGQRLQATSSAFGSRPVQKSVEEVEKEMKEKEMRMNKSEVFQLIISDSMTKARTKNYCAHCARPFATEADRSSFLEKKQKELNDMTTTNSPAAIKEELKALEAKMHALKVLEPVAVRHDSLRDSEIPSLRQRVGELEKELATLQDAVDDAARGEEAAGSAMQDAQEALQGGALPLARLATEANERREEVESLRVTVRTSDAARSVGSVDSELGQLETRRVELERVKEAAAVKLGRLRDSISSLQAEVHHERESLLGLRASVEKRASLERQKAELLTADQAMTDALIDARRATDPLKQRRDVLQGQRNEARAKARAVEVELEEVLRRLQTQETQFETRERSLREYEERGSAVALTRAEEKLSGIRARQAQEDEKLQSISDARDAKRAAVAGSESIQRQVLDLLAFRRSKNEEDTLAADIDSMSSAIAEVGDRGTLERTVRALEQQERELRSESDRAAGALGSLEDSIVAATENVSRPEYNDIEGKHRRAVIQLRTIEMASGDLEKFHKALERALLSFHTSKMSDINKIIKELWQKTYRNSDIDYIQIKADSEGAAQRSYNYKVTMVCGGAELDMRGRCSAGQRVLASLIIRLALAETFCLNCGILALDEPTTNLDAENSTSLAEALKALMLARREQENFQLIVITHDEVFARHIGTREHAEFMWRIVK